MNPPTVVHGLQQQPLGQYTAGNTSRRHFFGSGNQIFVDSFIATEDGSRNTSIV